MLTIYGVPVSVHTRKVIVACRLKDIAFRLEPVVPFDPPADWARLSPTGLIPAISHDGFELADSSAICAYLDRIAPRPALYPDDYRDFARALWIEQYAGAVVFRTLVHPLFHQKIIRPHILQDGDPDEREIERLVADVAPGVFAYLEAHVQDHALFGERLTIAGLSVACNLINYRYLGFALDADRFPHLNRWFHDTISAAPFAPALGEETQFADQMGLDRSFIG